MNRYLRREQLKDRWRGRRDGRRRTPSYSAQAELAESGQAVSAPYPDQLLALAQQQIAGIRENFERTAAANRTSLQTLRAQRQLAAKEVLKAAAEVTTAELPITEEELKPRNHTEAAFAGTDSLRGRRDELRRHRIAKAQAHEMARIKAHDEIVARIAAVEEQIKTQFVTAQANAAAMSEHYATRISTYWEHNAHVHPEGTYFAPLLRFVAQQLPTWVTDPPEGDPLDLGRGRLEHRVVTRSLDVPAPPVHYHEADPDIEESA
ncbi:hypothetical protein ABZ345_08670 [Lentzea sp. NPDC005914]|uniref:hypothetical protein n=1 Tax=Lentzea sp. NPDC005914 TaxID=3154572 RepID=UPI0033C7A9DE